MKTTVSLIIYSAKDTIINTAMVFSTASAANNYINELTHNQSTGVISFKKLRQGHYSLQTIDGITGEISINSVPDNQLRFYLLKSINGTYRETRMFTSRQNAVNYVTKFLDEYDFDPDDEENKLGSWEMKSGNIDVEFNLKATIRKSGKIGLDKYYEILGVDSSSSPEQIRRAYHRRSKETHPDMGGDASEFKKVNEAYEMLKNNSDNKKSKISIDEIVSSPDSADIEYILTEIRRKSKEAYNNSASNARREAAGPTIVIGLVMVGIGALATNISYNAAEEGGSYTIFSGLMIVGGYYILKGIVNLFKR